MSQPAAMAWGTCCFLGMVAPNIPIMWEASVTTRPLNPSWPFKRSVISSGASVAGRISSSFMPGRSFLEYAGSAICPAMIVMTPSSISSRYTFPYVRSHFSQSNSLMPIIRCWSFSSVPSPGKCFMQVAIFCVFIPLKNAFA